MFIEENDLIDVAIFYRKTGKSYIAYGEKDFNEAVKDESKSKFKKLVVSLRPMTWGLYNDLQEHSSVFDHNEGKNKFNFRRYKEEKLKKLIVKWDATNTDSNGNVVPIPVNEKNILNLSPSIAENIIAQYDEISVMDEEEEKK